MNFTTSRLGDHHGKFATQVFGWGPLIKIKLYHRGIIIFTPSLTHTDCRNPGEKHTLVYQPNTNNDKIDLQK